MIMVINGYMSDSHEVAFTYIPIIRSRPLNIATITRNDLQLTANYTMSSIGISDWIVHSSLEYLSE